MYTNSLLNAINKRSNSKGEEKINRLALHVLVLVATGCLISAHAAVKVQDSAAEVIKQQVLHHHNRLGLEDRVNVLSKALNLDEKQQSDLRKVLEGQREQVRMIWSDTSVPAAYRVIATQALSEKTADQIRALLNEEQKKKYNLPRQPHEATEGSAKPKSVEDWMMDAAKPK